jgi:hypothetical protein
LTEPNQDRVKEPNRNVTQHLGPLVESGCSSEEQSARLFKTYAHEVDADSASTGNGVVSLGSGDPKRFVECFAPMIVATVGRLRQDPHAKSETFLEQAAFNQIQSAAHQEPKLTAPWMPGDIFSNASFQKAFRAAVRRQAKHGPSAADRGKVRSSWLDGKMADLVITSYVDLAGSGGPSYNTIQRYRSGVSSTRDRYVRRLLAKAFGCTFAEVPE